MSEKTTLVTGATGFVGAYLLHFLVKNKVPNLRAIRRKNSPMDLVKGLENQVEWVEADLLDPTSLETAMRGTGRVYHCAGMVSFAPGEFHKMLKINQEGTANVVNLGLDLGIEKLVHVSSIAALGRQKHQAHFTEKNKWKKSRLNNPYGISKHMAEMEVWRGIAEGLPAAVVNPANIIGSGFWEGRTTTGQMFYKIWKGSMPFYPMGGSGFVDVRDCARFMVRLMDSDITGERYILSGENLSFQTVFNHIADILKAKRPHIKVTPLVRETAWRAAWLLSKFKGKKPFITKHTARSSAHVFYYENEKSRSAFPGFEYTPLRQTIEETARQFLENVDGFQPAVLPF